MKQSIIGIFLALGAAAALAACNSTANGGNPVPSAGPPCQQPGTLTMIYPINGATNVPDSTNYIYVSDNVSIGGNGYNSVVAPPNGGNVFPGSGFIAVPLSAVPAPRATPGAAGSTYYRSYIGTNGALLTGTYAIGFNNLNTACTPSQIGSFTAQ